VFQKRGPIGLMLHSIGCPQPNAMVLINNWNREDYNVAAVHAFIDGRSGTVYQTLPWNFRGWHGGGSSNNSNIVGVWKLVKLSGGGLELSGDQLEAFGMTGTIEFKSDGTGVTKMGDDETPFKYNASSNMLTDTETGESISYTIENGQLTVSEEDSTMVFEKQ
jgi:hypothetical protein